ncbi:MULTISPECIES: hypothetical protein [unclassified Actinomyces]|uniref:hypothetical protein n=1 Tax=unclassified Actinomyces TaxID=2609248 RepID=UPI0013A691BA|nr:MULTISPECIES: hypothetical protein [unclassified Actinomyces]MBW3068806.1 hypothetical protein [Actinomyces sp. 594]NDR54480.1 hypothetical protein [Actinomyces sp. 565]
MVRTRWQGVGHRIPILLPRTASADTAIAGVLPRRLLLGNAVAGAGGSSAITAVDDHYLAGTAHVHDALLGRDGLRPVVDLNGPTTWAVPSGATKPPGWDAGQPVPRAALVSGNALTDTGIGT